MLNRVIQIDAEIIPRLEQWREIGNNFYDRRDAGKLHPALFRKRLPDACHRAWVTLCARTKVERIDRSIGHFMLKT